MVRAETPRVLVLGATGMLGSMVLHFLARDERVETSAAARRAAALDGVRVLPFAGAGDLGIVDGHDWVVNAVGVIKPRIREDDPGDVENAIRVNALLPHELARAAADAGARVIQIATDCVYSGIRGSYVETDPHDALDVYGKTKSLGELQAPNVYHLRASIVGPEVGPPRSLLEWFRGQPPGATVSGYVNHRWNGITTLHFAKLCAAVIAGDAQLPPNQHIVPSGDVTKLELLELFREHFGRADITIEATEAATVVDRRLQTVRPDDNTRLWQAAGYDEPPAIAEMVAELSRSSALTAA
jgi:dTDP-4-dehydrorhamnose reductase